MRVKEFLVGLAFVVTMLVAPGLLAVAQAAEVEEFTYWYPWGGDSEKFTLECIANFQKANPNIKINAVYVPPDGGIENGKLLAAIAGGAAPDLVTTSQTAMGYALAAQGAFEPLDAPLGKLGFKIDDILVGFHDLMKYDGKMYLFPESTNVSLLYINTKLAKAAGLDLSKPPQTIAELDAWAEKLSTVDAAGKIQRLGFVPWLDGNSEDPFLMGWVFGAKFFDAAAKKVILKEKPLIDLLNWMGTYAKKYNPEKMKSFASGFGGAFSPDHPFFTEKVAMTINGNWFTNALKLYAPKIEYQVVPIPFPAGGREKATTLGTNVYVLPKGSKRPDAALKFVMYMVSPEIRAHGADVWRDVPIWKKPSDAIKWVKEGDPIYKMIMAIAASPNAGHPALTPIANQLREQLILIRDNVIFNGANPEPLLAEAEQKLQKEADGK